MPGEAWPWKKTWSPPPGWSLPRKKWLKPDLVQGRGPGVGGDVPADADIGPLRPVHHDRGVPPHVRPVPALDLLVPGERRFLVHRDRVHVIRGGDHRNTHGLRAGPLQQAAHYVLGTLGALFLNQRIQGLHPLGGLFRITIRQLVSQPAEDMGGIFSCSHVQPLFERIASAPSGSGRVTARRERDVCDVSVTTARSCAPGKVLITPMPACSQRGCSPSQA